MTLPAPYYEHAGIQIFHGDCREILPGLEPVDLLCVDPPYGIGCDGAIHCTKPSRPSTYTSGPKYKRESWDIRPSNETIKMMIDASRKQVIWGGNYFTSALAESRCWLYWDKMFDKTTNFSHGELAWTSFNFGVKQFRQSSKDETSGGRLRVHPTQKTMKLMRWCIQLCPGNPQTILDPFMGSGTTLVAAKQLNRRAIGIEIEEKYCEIAASRLSQEVFDFSAAVVRG